PVCLRFPRQRTAISPLCFCFFLQETVPISLPKSRLFSLVRTRTVYMWGGEDTRGRYGPYIGWWVGCHSSRSPLLTRRTEEMKPCYYTPTNPTHGGRYIRFGGTFACISTSQQPKNRHGARDQAWRAVPRKTRRLRP
ncbi:unnamed protein product, partial [Ectocarpus sp. 4 AP-2014]